MAHAIRIIEARNAGERPISVLTVEAGTSGGARPVLVFLHGRGEASIWPNEVPHVCDHQSPPFQALLGYLDEVTVVAPQAPYDMHPPKNQANGKPVEGNWNWRPQLERLCAYLRKEFPGRTVVAAGFSRGGLGVLQLMETCPGLISKWAIVDPQPADVEEEKRVIGAAAGSKGWSRYTNAHADIKTMGDTLAGVLSEGQHAFTAGLGHGQIALRAFQGEPLGGAKNIYDHLGVRQKRL